jgi:dipeptidyl aminopeptidase/acylaminoacyl peptidase
MKALFSTLIVGISLVLVTPSARSAEERDEPAASRSLTVDDYFRIRDVSDPQLSPDGRWVAYELTSTDVKEDESNTRIWMVPTTGGEPVPMTAEEKSASRPRWSPDGKYLAFLGELEDGETQVWTLFRQGGDSRPITEVKQGVSSYEWSPDGTRMVLVIKDPNPEDLKKDKGDDNSDETPPPWVITRLQFKMDYDGYLDSRRTHLYVLDLASKEMRQISSGDYDDSEPAWSRDGTHIAFVSNRSAEPDTNYNTDIWVVAADNPDKGQSLTQVTTNLGPDESPAWSPDGELIVHRCATDTDAMVYATNHLAVTPSAGGETRVLTQKLDRNVLSPRFSADGRSIQFLLEDSAEQSLVRLPVQGGDPDPLIGGPRSVSDFSVGPKGEIAALVSEPHLPPEVFLLEGGTQRRLTQTNDQLLDGIRLGEVENVHFASRDGTRIEGFIVKPPDFDPSLGYPAILRIHGGPTSQYDFGFHFEAQLFAAHGYVVMLPNPRGSTGYGQEFSIAIWQDWGGIDYEDVMAAVDDAVARGYADPDRLGVGGWSYGGMLTNHVITKTDRFKAAYTGASATLYVANYGHDQYQRWWEQELGLPWQNRELWEKLSPFNQVEKVVTPTLIVGGEKDWNVPIINSEQLYLALKRLGKTTELVVYPGEYHEFGTPSYNQDLYQRFLAWFDRYVKGVAVPASDGG